MTERDRESGDEKLDALAQALRGAYCGRVDVPAEVDDAMRARMHLPLARLRRRRLLWLAVPAAAAATLAVALYFGSATDRSTAGRAPDARAPQVSLHVPPADSAPLQPAIDAGRHTRVEDVNGDGRVDIRDALVLARKLRAGGPLEGGWDLSGDGVVDRTDVERIAWLVVSVPGGRP
jgi:hypothetical protein